MGFRQSSRGYLNTVIAKRCLDSNFKFVDKISTSHKIAQNIRYSHKKIAILKLGRIL